MFTLTHFDRKRESQGELSLIARLVGQGRVQATIRTKMQGLTPETLIEAHRLQERGATIGETVIAHH